MATATEVAGTWLGIVEPVTIAVNNLRSDSASAVNSRKSNCGVCGAEFDLINTIWIGNRRKFRNCTGHQAAGLGRAA